MQISAFSLGCLPRIEFGSGVLQKLPALARQFGQRLLLITGQRSLQLTPHHEHLLAGLRREAMQWQQASIAGEPSPQLIDDLVRQFRHLEFDVVIGIGGGSALDAAKAVAGLLRIDNSIMDFLEGVGPQLPYPGPAVPFIAVPTTAGTGSEATRNAVLSVPGRNGFKKSFRDEQLVPRYAVVDPDLLAACPPALIAANGMDALTQLLESYVSTRANAFTDALAADALGRIGDSLLRWFDQGADARPQQSIMAYCALISGITLAQVGLGSVHGLAAPLGAFFPIPHGVACGTLLATATRVNIEALRQRAPGHPALAKYAHAAALLCGREFADQTQALQALLDRLQDWTDYLQLPLLSHYGVSAADVDHIVANSRGSSMKTNPLVLEDAEIAAIVSARL